MTREFSKISPQVWRSERFRGLCDDSGKLLYLYLLSSAHQNSAGCYRLTLAYACDDIGWDPPQFHPALEELVAAGLVEEDAETQEILILRWFRHNPPTNEKHLKGVERLIGMIESPVLRARAEAELDVELSEAPRPWRTGRKSTTSDVADVLDFSARAAARGGGR